jgi:putative acetyltransferase
MTLMIERVDPQDRDARRLLDEHARHMASRYPGQTWAGVDGSKDALWLARDAAGGAVGCVARRDLGDGNVEVKHLFVLPEARRRGIASALMDAFEADAARRGAGVVLETGTGQPEAIAFYQRRGHRIRGRYEGSDPSDTCSVYLGRDAPQPGRRGASQPSGAGG